MKIILTGTKRLAWGAGKADKDGNPSHPGGEVEQTYGKDGKPVPVDVPDEVAKGLIATNAAEAAPTASKRKAPAAG